MKKSIKPASLLKYIISAVFILALVLFMYKANWRGKLPGLTVEHLSQYLLSFGAWAYVLGIAAVLIQTVVPIIPFVLVAGANILIFGLFWGFVVNYVMSVVGAALSFWFARSIGQQWVLGKLNNFPTVEAFNDKLERSGFFYVLIGRLIPIVPSSAINFSAGAMKVKASHFMTATILGKFPIVLLECFIGHDMLHFHQNKGRLLLLVGIFAVLLAIGGWIKRMITHKSAV
ncbi:TVP38/TMEM64 family protein [Paenibacillus sp. J2TS4]|uniref:TVP38/TMEM64 family protein n=1 Tax=Paenibacillus sp. J2TS4 TaxID=2807194 RepID=UPI001B0F2859|nr:TVP38/TMEM64 family protein [Paenibacillus sp. J2TS4]GIP32912.1 TVP38/TMEM64 family protein [Paenibacillus sp. J2TS4]